MKKPIRILVADDNAPLRKVMKDVLTRAGYEVLLAEDGLDALEMALAVKPDLVITDGLMPKLHGFLACKMLKQLEPPPKVILLTAVYTKPEYRTEVKEQYGADELLTKPCRTADLLACIENLLSQPGGHKQETGDFDLLEA